jgi:hypothetical protein
MNTTDSQPPSTSHRTSRGVAIRLMAAMLALAAGMGAVIVAVTLVRSALG